MIFPSLQATIPVQLLSSKCNNSRVGWPSSFGPFIRFWGLSASNSLSIEIDRWPIISQRPLVWSSRATTSRKQEKENGPSDKSKSTRNTLKPSGGPVSKSQTATFNRTRPVSLKRFLAYPKSPATPDGLASIVQSTIVSFSKLISLLLKALDSHNTQIPLTSPLDQFYLILTLIIPVEMSLVLSRIKSGKCHDLWNRLFFH